MAGGWTRTLLGLGLLPLLAWCGQASAQPGGSSCLSGAQLDYLCGPERPEDLVPLPGTRWLVASGYYPGAGLKLVDIEASRYEIWYRGSADQIRIDRGLYPNCPGPPEPRLMSRGLSLRPLGAGRFRLYAVNHAGRESIEIFEIRLHRSAPPAISWIGCLPMPPGQVGNSVASFSDGTVLATVLTRPGTAIADFVRGHRTGVVLEWRPGDAVFRPLPGTELPGNNGIETSPDDRQFYVVAFGWHSIAVYDRADTSVPRRVILAPDFMPDNLRWSAGRLIAAGMRYDEPACGGLRRIVDGVADPMRCHRGYVVAALDPRRGRWSILADSGPEADFNGVSTAVVVGDRLWLGSYQSDRLASRHLSSALRPRRARSR